MMKGDYAWDSSTRVEHDTACGYNCTRCVHFVSTGNGEGYCTVDGRRLGGLFADPTQHVCRWFDSIKDGMVYGKHMEVPG